MLNKVSLIICVTFLFSYSIFSQNVFVGKVMEVVDGRTAIFVTKGVSTMILLNNIEVPETEQELSKTVKDHFSVLTLNKDARFVVTSQFSKGYNGKLFIGENEINKQMLRDGAAWFNVPECESDPNSNEYIELEKLAKTEKRGVWSVEGLKPAWVFREEKYAKEIERKNLERKKATETAMLKKPPTAVVWGEITGTRTTVTNRGSTINSKNGSSGDAGETLTKKSYDRLHKVAGLGADIADDFASSLNSTNKVYNYTYLKESVNAIDDGIYNIRRSFEKPQNLQLLENIQNTVSDINLILNILGKTDKVYYRDDIISLANRYSVSPVVAANGEKVILKQMILSSMFGSIKNDFTNLQLNVSLSKIEDN